MEHAQDTPAESTKAKLRELTLATGRGEQDLVGEGVDRLYRIYIGDPPTDTDHESTSPFSKKYSERAAEVVVRQVTPATFKLREPFKYIDRDRRFEVPEHDVSDFASVPSFLTWLIPATAGTPWRRCSTTTCRITCTGRGFPSQTTRKRSPRRRRTRSSDRPCSTAASRSSDVGSCGRRSHCEPCSRAASPAP